VPVLLPPLIAAYAVWARLPSLHGTLKPIATSSVVGALVVMLIALPFAARWYADRPDPEREARIATEFKARQAEEERRYREEREQEAAAFARLGPESSVMDYLPYLAGNLRERAAEGIKKVKSRQTDIVMLLQTKGLDGSPNLMLLDLQP